MGKHILNYLSIVWVLSASHLFAADSYIIGVGDYEYLPYHTYLNSEYSGFAKEVLDLFARKHQFNFSYRALPWKRVIKEYTTGKLDLIFPDNPHWDEIPKAGIKVYYSRPVVQYIDGVMVLPENKGRGLSYLKELGTISGFTAWGYLDPISSGQIKLYENRNFIPLLKQVLKNRIDGAYIEISVANYNFRTPDLS